MKIGVQGECLFLKRESEFEVERNPQTYRQRETKEDCPREKERENGRH